MRIGTATILFLIIIFLKVSLRKIPLTFNQILFDAVNEKNIVVIIIVTKKNYLLSIYTFMYSIM